TIKSAAFAVDSTGQRLWTAKVEGSGLDDFQRVLDDLRQHLPGATIAAIGHRIVHGGPRFAEPQRITPEIVAELKRIAPLAPEHLPAEIAIIEACRERLAGVPQLACFDTAFHHNLPRVAQTLPIARKYQSAGVRRYGFHGLSYAYLIEELAKVAGNAAARGRVVLAHLGAGASMAAVHQGQCIDTTMAMTPTAGLVMATRSGDLDPGLMIYLLREHQLSLEELDRLVNRQSGLLGFSDTSADMRQLQAARTTDDRAAEAIDIFCYSARKWIGALVAALGGLDTLVFAGGIGENSPDVRAAICTGLDCLGIVIDPSRNRANAAVISAEGGRATVRVIKTDEELMILRQVQRCVLDRAANERHKA
ncbi:MAG TPA: acetate/propionate family kinase, partial [Pirellulales bacterium]|nr:acetate/propionate family kinase [Pirellulales bacterium]